MTGRILIVDDDSTIRMLVRRLLENHGMGEVCGEAAHGPEAIQKTAQLIPDLVILDLAMPAMNGIEAGRQIAKANPTVPLLLMSVQQVSNQLADAAREAGFKGAVTKSSGNEVVQAVAALFRNETFFAVDEPLSV